MPLKTAVHRSLTATYAVHCISLPLRATRVSRLTMRVEIEPVWRFRRADDHSMLLMLDLLMELRAVGKIGRAAERAGISYRHCWNLIQKWGDFFGTPLVELSRGRGARLTVL